MNITVHLGVVVLYLFVNKTPTVHCGFVFPFLDNNSGWFKSPLTPSTMNYHTTLYLRMELIVLYREPSYGIITYDTVKLKGSFSISQSATMDRTFK